MNSLDPSSDPQPSPSSRGRPLREEWPIAVVAILLCVASGYMSAALALLSINVDVIKIFLSVNVLCFIATIVMIFRRRYGIACLVAISPVPLGFGLSVAYMYLRYP